MTKIEFTKLKEKTAHGFYLFHNRYEFIVRFNRIEKSLFIRYRTIKYRGGCDTEKEAIELSFMMLNKWIDE